MTISASRRHHHVHRAAAADRQRLAQQRTGQIILVLADAQLGRAGQHHGRVRADHHRHLQVLPPSARRGGDSPRCAGGCGRWRPCVWPLDLKPDVGQVADAGVGVARGDHPRGDVRPGVLREVARDRQFGQVGLRPLPRRPPAPGRSQQLAPESGCPALPPAPGRAYPASRRIPAAITSRAANRLAASRSSCPARRSNKSTGYRPRRSNSSVSAVEV